MPDRTEITPRMVAEAYVNPGNTFKDSAAAYENDDWIKRVAKGLTEQLNPPPWTAEGIRVKRSGPDRETLEISVYTDSRRHGNDTEVRRRMASALAEILNEKDFKREDYS